MMKKVNGEAAPQRPPKGPSAQTRTPSGRPRGGFASIVEFSLTVLEDLFEFLLECFQRQPSYQEFLRSVQLLFDVEGLARMSRPFLKEVPGGRVVCIPMEMLSLFQRPGLSRKEARKARSIPRRYITACLPMFDAPPRDGGPRRGDDEMLVLASAYYTNPRDWDNLGSLMMMSCADYIKRHAQTDRRT